MKKVSQSALLLFLSTFIPLLLLSSSNLYAFPNNVSAENENKRSPSSQISLPVVTIFDTRIPFPTSTPTSAGGNTPTPTPTTVATNTATATATSVPTSTPTATNTATRTPTMTATSTATASSTPTPTNTPQPQITVVLFSETNTKDIYLGAPECIKNKKLPGSLMPMRSNVESVFTATVYRKDGDKNQLLKDAPIAFSKEELGRLNQNRERLLFKTPMKGKTNSRGQFSIIVVSQSEECTDSRSYITATLDDPQFPGVKDSNLVITMYREQKNPYAVARSQCAPMMNSRNLPWFYSLPSTQFTDQNGVVFNFPDSRRSYPAVKSALDHWDSLTNVRGADMFGLREVQDFPPASRIVIWPNCDVTANVFAYIEPINQLATSPLKIIINIPHFDGDPLFGGDNSLFHRCRSFYAPASDIVDNGFTQYGRKHARMTISHEFGHLTCLDHLSSSDDVQFNNLYALMRFDSLGYHMNGTQTPHLLELFPFIYDRFPTN